ncbi:proteinral transcription repressor [Orbilia oligospora]|uniref:Proteinral transcription repressor n=1 Tax=Orbilia oligospora TaxID=2813651 RepID=A0A7C8KB39_ORBOL|nr:proteinral transcription repressor [Orbilia oligospora]
MFNAHRGHVPGAAPNRFNEIIDQLRAEFDAQIQRGAESDHKVNSQMQEMEMIQRAVFNLESNYSQMKKQYEEQIANLTRELEKYTGQAPHPGQGQSTGPSTAQPVPPVLHQGRGGLFGDIMSGTTQVGGPNMTLADPSAHQQPSQQQPGGPSQSGSHPPPGPHNHPIHAPQPISTPQVGPQPPAQPPQQPPSNYPPAQPSSFGQNGFSGPSTQPQPQPPAPTAQSLTPRPNKGIYHLFFQPTTVRLPGGREVLTQRNHKDLDISRIPQTHKKEGADWFAYFNPRVPRVLDVDLVHTLEHNSVVCCVRFSHDGKYLATGCNRSAQIFDVQTGHRVTLLQDETVDRGGDLYIRSVCFSPDGYYLATGAEDRQIRVWDIKNKRIKHNFRGHEQDIYSLDFSKNGRYIASGSGDKTVRIWDMENPDRAPLAFTIEDGVTTVAISPDSRFVAAGSLDKCIRIWEIATGKFVERLEGSDRPPQPEGPDVVPEPEPPHDHNEGHRDSVYSVAFTANGTGLISGSLDKTVKMWTLSSASSQGVGQKLEPRVKTFEGHEDFVLSVAQTPDAYGPWVMSGSKDRRVQFWDPRTNQTQLMLQGHKNSVISVAPSPAGKLFATGSGDYKARIWSYDRV